MAKSVWRRYGGGEQTHHPRMGLMDCQEFDLGRSQDPTEANESKDHEELVNLRLLSPNITSKRHQCQELLLKRGNLANIIR